MANTSKLNTSSFGGSGSTAASTQQTAWAISASLRSLAIAIFLVLASPPMLHAAFVDGIEQISESYQISGSWADSMTVAGPLPPPFGGSFNLSSSDGTPVAGSGSTIGASASASVEGFSTEGFSLQDQAVLGAFVVSGSASASALAVWDFRPAGGFLKLNLAITDQYFVNYYLGPGNTGGESLSVMLTDTTTSTTLLDLPGVPESPPPGYGGPVPYNYIFNVNPSDVYELSASASSGHGEAGSWTQDVDASIMSAPTPDFPDGGLTIGMLGMAMGGLAFIRRKLSCCG